MFKAISFMVSFISCFLVLSIPVKKEKLVFDYVHSFTSPYMTKTYNSVKRLFSGSVKKHKAQLESMNKDEVIDQIKEIINEGKKASSQKIEEAFDEYDFRSDSNN